MRSGSGFDRCDLGAVSIGAIWERFRSVRSGSGFDRCDLNLAFSETTARRSHRLTTLPADQHIREIRAVLPGSLNFISKQHVIQCPRKTDGISIWIWNRRKTKEFIVGLETNSRMRYECIKDKPATSIESSRHDAQTGAALCRKPSYLGYPIARNGFFHALLVPLAHRLSVACLVCRLRS